MSPPQKHYTEVDLRAFQAYVSRQIAKAYGIPTGMSGILYGEEEMTEFTKDQFDDLLNKNKDRDND